MFFETVSRSVLLLEIEFLVFLSQIRLQNQFQNNEENSSKNPVPLVKNIT